MSIVLKYVYFFTKEGRLLKEIPRSEFPKELPDFISYAGNFFVRAAWTNDFTERGVYVYAEQPVTTQLEDENASMHHSDVDPAKQTT